MKKNKKIIEYIKDYLNWVPPKSLMLLILSIFAIFVSLFLFRIDNDFWFLINTGEYILDNGFPLIEPFTIHSNLEFIVQQWLTDVIFYLVYNNFGIYGMYVLVTSINLIIIYLTYKIATLLTENKFKTSAAIAIIINISLDIHFVTTRPQIFDIVLLLLEIYLLELYIKKNNKLYLLGLPVISLLMINLHSSLWLMIFVFLLPYYVERIKPFRKDKYKLKPIIFITIIMFIVGFINPYGIDSIKYLFNSYGIDIINNFVDEMKPIKFSENRLIFIYMFIIFISYYYNRKNIKPRYLFLTLGTCYLALSHYKGVLYFFVTSVLPLSYNFKNLFTTSNKESVVFPVKIINFYTLSIMIIYSVIYICLLFNFDLKEKNKPYLYNIANYLDENATKDIKLYTGYADGSYLEYRGYKCYIDPRAEVFLDSNNKKENILLEYYMLQNGRITGIEILNKYNFDYLILTYQDMLYYYMNDNYELVYQEEIKDLSNSNTVYMIYKRIENNEEDL